MNKNQGFTLIELLVVVLIIGILSAVALPQYQRVVDKSRMTQALTWAKSIRDAERVYYMANSEWTRNMEDLDISFKCTPGESVGVYTCEDGYSFQLTSVPSVYVYLPTKFTGGAKAGIEYYFAPNRDTRLCFASASSERFIHVCESYGGTIHTSREAMKYYNMP